MVPAFAVKFVESLIAAMITIVPPGYTMYSQVPIAYCDEACQQTPLCEGGEWKCKPPRFDPEIYQSKTQVLVAQGKSFEEATLEAKPLSYTRPETYEEGLVRYQIIAESVVNSSLKMSAPVCRNNCKAQYGTEGQTPDEPKYLSCKSYCSRFAPWKYSWKELAYLTVTAWGMESGFRADVHGGVSPAGRGDCGYFKANKQVSPKTVGATRLCKSVCLGQINLGGGYTLVANKRWFADDIVGIDSASTERCAMASQNVLARAREFCTSPWGGGGTRDWAGAVFSLYGTGNKCDVPKLMSRGHLFWKLYRNPTDLTPEVQAKLGDANFLAATDFLRQSSPILWTVPIENYTPPVVPVVSVHRLPMAQSE